MKAGAVVAYVVAGLALDAISLPNALFPLAQSPWNPAAGLSIAFMLLFGLRAWPLLFAASLLANLLIHGWPQAPLPTFAGALSLALSYAGIVAFLQYRARVGPDFQELRDVTWFVATAAVGTLFAAGLYILALGLAGASGNGQTGIHILQFWVADLIRLLVVAPLVLAWADLRPGQVRWRAEPVWMAAAIALALWVIFGIEATDEFKFFYLLFLPLIWIALRYGLRGASLALLGIHVGLNALLEWRGHGPITVLEFKMLMLGLALTGLFMGMTVTGRRLAEARLARREAELHQALRLAAAGEMAQTLAHELNQPLTALASYAGAARGMLADPGRHAELLAETLEKIGKEALRAGKAIHHLREFFRHGQLRLESTAPADLVAEALAPARRRAERLDVELIVQPLDDLPRIRVDRVQAGAILHNLVNNALDALAESGAGWREIEVRAALDDDDGQPDEDGRWLRLCVSDSGPGIAPDILPRLFQPFASGKPEGMGLGLVICRTLAEAHGGRLWLASSHPTRFCFTLPRDVP